MVLGRSGGVKFNALKAQSTATTREITIGSGNSESQYIPFRSKTCHAISQQIYTYEEILTASKDNLPEGNITKITFTTSRAYNDIEYDQPVIVYMKNVEKEYFTGTNASAWYKDFSSSDKVYEGCPKLTEGKLEIKLSGDGFKYNEGYNILLYADINDPSYSLDVYFKTYSSSYTEETTGNIRKRCIYKANTTTGTTNYGIDGNWPAATQNSYNNIITFTFSSGGSDDTPVYPGPVKNPTPLDGSMFGTSPNQKLEWEFGANTTHYQVLVGTEIEDGENGRVINTLGQESFVEKSESDNGSYTVEGLEPSTKYFWQVISRNEEDATIPETAGPVWEFTTIAQVDEKPAMVVKKSPENNTIIKTQDVSLKWQYQDENATRYLVYLGTSIDGMVVIDEGQPNYSTTDLMAEFKPDNLQGEKTYYWRVDVKNSIETPDENIWSFTTQSVGNIDGIVKNNDVFVSGATISIKDLNGNLVGSTTTTAGSGNFAFNDVVIGEYYLYIEVEGMETYTLELNVEAGKTTSLGTIYLPSIIATDDSWNITNAELSEFNELIVRANAVLQTTAKVGSLTIESGKSVTIKDGAVLTVVGKINNNGEIIIEDGGQIYQNNEDVYATFKMNVENPEEWLENNTTGWQFISSPFVDATVASFIPSEGEYDLYKYDGKQELEWVNHKGENSGGSGESGDTFYYDFNDASVDDWTKIDADGDGKNWGVTSSGIYAGYEESVGLYSSCYAGDELYPDNYFVTNKTYAITSTSFLSFLHHTSDALYTEENFGVVVSENGTDWIVIWSKKYDYNAPDEDWQEANVSLADYAGKNVYLGFRHYNCNGSSANGIRIDNVRLSSGSRNQTRGTSSFEETFAQGVGYLASYETEETATLSGNLFNEDNFTFKVSYNEDKDIANFHLLGNPFPFNMDWSNISLEGVYDGFATVDPATGGYITATEGAIPVGDGFFVKATAANPRISYATASKSRGKKSEYINVVAIGKQGSNNVIIKLDGEEKVGFAKLNNINPSIADVYVKNNDRQYSILSYDRNVTEVELFFNAKEMGNYSISLDVNGKFESVTLVDRITGIETNMLLENEYNFTATSNDNPNRFVIRLDNGQQTTDNGQFVYQSGEELILSIEGSVQIVDMLGRVVYSNEHSNGNNRISVSEFNNAAYVIRVVNEEGVKTQKVVIY